jgi:hypothetical protein
LRKYLYADKQKSATGIGSQNFELRKITNYHPEIRFAEALSEIKKIKITPKIYEKFQVVYVFFC